MGEVQIPSAHKPGTEASPFTALWGSVGTAASPPAAGVSISCLNWAVDHFLKPAAALNEYEMNILAVPDIAAANTWVRFVYLRGIVGFIVYPIPKSTALE
jgi:hypothetical protein